MKEKHVDIIRQLVKDRYAKAAGASGCGCMPQQTASCCGSSDNTTEAVGQIMGYSREELDSVIEVEVCDTNDIPAGSDTLPPSILSRSPDLGLAIIIVADWMESVISGSAIIGLLTRDTAVPCSI